MVPASRTPEWWDHIAELTLLELVSQRGAIVWREAEALLTLKGSAGPWIAEHVLPGFNRSWVIDPIHLAKARDRLVAAGAIIEASATLQGRRVNAYIDPTARATRRRTEVERLAASKRRLYRRFLTWTNRPTLCGRIGELVTDASMRVAAEEGAIWMPPNHRPGQVKSLLGRPLLAGGTLDAAGAWFSDPSNPLAGVTPFAVEVKNLRTTLYPHHDEVWDLLAKTSDFPDVLPVLVATHIHPMTFKFFSDIGAVGFQGRRQWFSAAIDPDEFRRVIDGLGFHDAQQAGDPPEHHPYLTGFFRKAGGDRATQPLQRWQHAAPIVARYQHLRASGLDSDDRWRDWCAFAAEVERAGLVVKGGWSPT